MKANLQVDHILKGWYSFYALYNVNVDCTTELRNETSTTRQSNTYKTDNLERN